MGENSQGLLNKIKSWLREPEVRSCVYAVSSVVGLLCFALSSSSNDLVGKWSWWKRVIYVAFSFILCCFTWFSNEWQRSIPPRLKGRMAFVFLMITDLYSYVFDEKEKKKPDAYILISYAAFAIMSLSLCSLGPLGTDLLYFFCGLLLIQSVKTNLWLVIIVAAIFIYSLIILSSSGDAVPQDQDQDLESGLRYVSQVDPLQPPQSPMQRRRRQLLQRPPQPQPQPPPRQLQERRWQEQEQERLVEQPWQRLVQQRLLLQRQEEERQRRRQLQPPPRQLQPPRRQLQERQRQEQEQEQEQERLVEQPWQRLLQRQEEVQQRLLRQRQRQLQQQQRLPRQKVP